MKKEQIERLERISEVVENNLCPICGKKFVKAIDTITKKKKYCWKASCDCYPKGFRLLIG